MKGIIPLAEDSENIKTFFNHVQQNSISIPSTTRQRRFGNITHTPSHSIPLSMHTSTDEQKEINIISSAESTVNQAQSDLIEQKKSKPPSSGIKRTLHMSESHSHSGKVKTTQRQNKKHEHLIPVIKKKKKHQELKTIF